MKVPHLDANAVLRQVVLAFLSALIPNACLAQESQPPSDWRVDCVGRMQLSMPAAADLPFTPLTRIESLLSLTKPHDSLPFEFADGSPGGHTDLHYRGIQMLSGPLNTAKLNDLFAANTNARRLQAQKDYRNRTAPDESKYTISPITLGIDGASAWQFYGSHFALAVRYGDHILASMFDTHTVDLDRSRAVISAFAKSISPRPLFDSPPKVGVCLPYTFISDDGDVSRSIGVTYRLQDHPDVTIWLEDSSASSPMPDQDATKFTAEYRTEFFWGQDYQSRKAYRSLWPGTRQVQLDGRKGVASLVELKRDDDTIDYGYLAVARGDPNAKQDTPDLMLYVIRDAKNAVAKGKQPIDKDDFVKMAQTIAASVRHRPVQ